MPKKGRRKTPSASRVGAEGGPVNKTSIAVPSVTHYLRLRECFRAEEHTGEALDYKTPLLKALNAVDKAATAVCQYFDRNITKVTPTLGPEQEYFVVGVTFDHRDDQVTLYIQGKHNPDYARNLAEAIVDARETANFDPDRFRADLIENYLANGSYRLTAVQPYSDHTVHIVDVNNAKVMLLDKDTYEPKFGGYTLSGFLERYGL